MIKEVLSLGQRLSGAVLPSYFKSNGSIHYTYPKGLRRIYQEGFTIGGIIIHIGKLEPYPTGFSRGL
ncbi:MAG: hypothetical protein ABI045_07395 [Flavobacteriales bacterium]